MRVRAIRLFASVWAPLLCMFAFLSSAPAGAQEKERANGHISIASLDEIVKASRNTTVQRAWSELQSLLDGSFMTAEQPLQAEIGGILERLKAISQPLIRAGKLLEPDWEIMKVTMRGKALKTLRFQSQLLFSHVSDPNYAGLFSPAVVQNSERLWSATHSEDGEPSRQNLIAVFKSLKSLEVDTTQREYHWRLAGIETLINVFAALSGSEAEAGAQAEWQADTHLPRIIGDVTECKLGMIHGWVYSTDSPGEPLAVLIIINGRRFALTANREVRGEPLLNQINSYNHGFMLEFYDFETGVNTVEAFAADPATGDLQLLESISLTIN